MELYELKEEQERVILVGVATRDNEDVQDSLDELEELVETAGAQTVGRVVQSREGIHPGYYVGTGKLEEIQMAVRALDATGIVCDDELSPSQMNNLERELECKVMDRTVVILDIFASRAKTSEGKIQVELAQLRYRAARLTGLGTSLSRLGGGIGTRGPGEKKLEVDRRLIKTRISQLKRELEQVKRHRELLREGRKKDNLLTGAIVGYTNAGKSTLLNTLTDAGVLEEDKLFATLDPTTRVLELPGKQNIYLTDTVGFIRKLPHHLIEAFKSTLEEAKYADVIIHVVDASNPQMDEQMFVVYETLKELGVKDKKVVTLFNKQDKISKEEIFRDFQADYVLKISARTGEGLEEFKAVMEKILTENQIYLERNYSYQEAGKIQLIRKYGQLLEEEYTPQGIYVKAKVPASIYGKIEEDRKQ
ncbi:MAG TPA: GTPase HflX [Candidatus Blautia merdigallinarum]|uniref:GTPase HflX n=1 Tax=Candidatus Blautia merdigallinarum TaxID=2838495 RepID=A0A9D2N6L2_9FIRM|nr:GTPase HflX [Candidatus Blautia merdigallinarum]